jgi:hypothetical protein
MLNKNNDIAWLQACAADYHLGTNDKGGVVEDLDEIGKLRQRFALVDELEEVDLGGGSVA